MKRFATLLLLFASMATPVPATDWPQWRGPFFNGSSDETGLPATWSRTENVVWATPLPGPSGATPAICQGRVFVSSTDKAGGDLRAMCLDAGAGQVLWSKTSPGDDKRYPNNTMASPSPVTDGQIVCFLYGTGRLVAFDYEGRELWAHDLRKDVGVLSIKYGYASSPLLYKNRLYVIVLRNAESKYAPSESQEPLPSCLLAFDARTGQRLWKRERPTDAMDESFEAYTTPIPFEAPGRSEILITGGDYYSGHDPDTGAELWRFLYNVRKTNRCRTVPSVTPGDGFIYGLTPRNRELYAVPAGRSGLIPTDQAAWVFTESTSDVCTPLLYRGRLYVIDERKKLLKCLDAATGELKWEGRLGGKVVFRASPTGADGKVYCVNMAGDVVVVAAEDQFRVLAQASMGGDPCLSSIAVSNQRLFIRTADTLYCVGK